VNDADRYTVKLVRDLTRLHPALVEGARGVMLKPPPVGRTSRYETYHLPCSFEAAGGNVKLDVSSKDLEITDERWLRWLAEEEEALKVALENHVEKALLTETSKGGFVELLVSYKHGRPNDRWIRPREANWIVKLLEEKGLLERKSVAARFAEGPGSWRF
jgi:hypothetical protein